VPDASDFPSATYDDVRRAQPTRGHKKAPLEAPQRISLRKFLKRIASGAPLVNRPFALRSVRRIRAAPHPAHIRWQIWKPCRAPRQIQRQRKGGNSMPMPGRLPTNSRNARSCNAAVLRVAQLPFLANLFSSAYAGRLPDAHCTWPSWGAMRAVSHRAEIELQVPFNDKKRIASSSR
jgi:hypothetical protein